MCVAKHEVDVGVWPCMRCVRVCVWGGGGKHDVCLSVWPSMMCVGMCGEVPDLHCHATASVIVMLLPTSLSCYSQCHCHATANVVTQPALPT